MTNDEIIASLQEANDRSKSNTHRLDRLEQRQDDLETLAGSVKVLADRQERMDDDVKEIKRDVKTIAEKPVRRGEAIVDKLIYALLAAVMAYLLARVGIA